MFLLNRILYWKLFYSAFVFDWNFFRREKLFFYVCKRSKFVNRSCFSSVPIVGGVKYIFVMTWILPVSHWFRDPGYCWTFSSSILTPAALISVVLLAPIFYEFHVQFIYSVMLFDEFQYFHYIEIAWRFILGASSCFLKLLKILSVEEKCITRLFCYKGMNVLTEYSYIDKSLPCTTRHINSNFIVYIFNVIGSSEYKIFNNVYFW